jgi:hypothetical protein
VLISHLLFLEGLEEMGRKGRKEAVNIKVVTEARVGLAVKRPIFLHIIVLFLPIQMSAV